MPFKTRRQKLSAVQRRYTFSGQKDLQVQYATGDMQKVVAAEEGSQKNDGEKRRQIDADYGYVRRDFLKVIFAAAVIGAGQVFIKLMVIQHH